MAIPLKVIHAFRFALTVCLSSVNVTIFDNDFYRYQDLRADYGEKRYVTIGLLHGVEIAVIHTPRNGKYRIISARRARVKERKLYYDKINNRAN